MKAWLVLGALALCSGCTTVTIPQYIQDEHPYPRKFYADFDKVLGAVAQALEDSGWQISKKADPATFEQNKSPGGEDIRQILIFTEVRQTSLILATRYARMNIYLRAADPQTTDAEVRYLTVTSTFFHGFHHYRNNRFIERLFTRVEELLEK